MPFHEAEVFCLGLQLYDLGESLLDVTILLSVCSIVYIAWYEDPPSPKPTGFFCTGP